MEERGWPDGLVIIDEVEYFRPGMFSGDLLSKKGQIYLGSGPRRSDGMHCLSVMTPGKGRRHNIEVGSIRAVTIAGVRHVLETPPSRFRIRAQELVRVIEGDFSEEWARPYFDPASDKYFRASVPYAPSERTLLPDGHYVSIDGDDDTCLQEAPSPPSSRARQLAFIALIMLVIALAKVGGVW